MIKVQVSGSFNKTTDFLNRMKRREQFKVLQKYGPMGVRALSQATPVDDADTANSWYYQIVDKPGYFGVHWLNSALDDDGKVPIAVLIQYGHATGTGGLYRVEITSIRPCVLYLTKWQLTCGRR
jgi:hypothetical protein